MRLPKTQSKLRQLLTASRQAGYDTGYRTGYHSGIAEGQAAEAKRLSATRQEACIKVLNAAGQLANANATAIGNLAFCLDNVK